MRAARTDSNQQAIVDAYRAVGWVVFDTHRTGGGYPDLHIAKDGRSILIECKVPGGRLTPAEREFIENWPGELYVVRSVDEALEAVGL